RPDLTVLLLGGLERREGGVFEMSVETSSGFLVTMPLIKGPPVANAKAERMEATGQLAMPGACLICVEGAVPLDSGVETAWASMLSRSPLRGWGMVVDFMIQAPAGTLRVTSACVPLFGIRREKVLRLR